MLGPYLKNAQEITRDLNNKNRTRSEAEVPGLWRWILDEKLKENLFSDNFEEQKTAAIKHFCFCFYFDCRKHKKPGSIDPGKFFMVPRDRVELPTQGFSLRAGFARARGSFGRIVMGCFFRPRCQSFCPHRAGDNLHFVRVNSFYFIKRIL